MVIYYVVERDTPEGLGEIVNEYLATGWELQGGLCTALHHRYEGGAPYEIRYLQAIKKID